MEQIEKAVSPSLGYMQEMFLAVWNGAIELISLPQIIAVGVAVFFGLMLHTRVRAGLVTLQGKVNLPLWHRFLKTAFSISLPIACVLFLWLSLAVLGAFDQTTALVRLCASLLNAWIVIRIVSTLIPNSSLSGVFAWAAWGVAALNAFGQLDSTITWLDGVRLDNKSINISLWEVMQGALVTALLLWLAYSVSGFVQTRLEKSASLNPSMRVLTSKLLRIALIAIAIVLGMQSVGIDLTAFAVFSGALGLGVGLGMQRTVSNLVAGFTMLADRSIKPGDVIEIETGDGPTRGEVKTLGARYVSVKTRSGTETLIPNELLISNPVTNWTFTDKRVRRGIPIGVSYKTDVEMAQKLCVEAALRCGRVLKDPKPVCLLTGFGASSVDLDLRFWMTDPADGIANISSDVFLEVWKLFREHDIEIPFPQQDLHIRSGLREAIAAA